MQNSINASDNSSLTRIFMCTAIACSIIIAVTTWMKQIKLKIWRKKIGWAFNFQRVVVSIKWNYNILLTWKKVWRMQSTQWYVYACIHSYDTFKPSCNTVNGDDDPLLIHSLACLFTNSFHLFIYWCLSVRAWAFSMHIFGKLHHF